MDSGNSNGNGDGFAPCTVDLSQAKQRDLERRINAVHVITSAFFFGDPALDLAVQLRVNTLLKG